MMRIMGTTSMSSIIRFTFGLPMVSEDDDDDDKQARCQNYYRGMEMMMMGTNVNVEHQQIYFWVAHGQ